MVFYFFEILISGSAFLDYVLTTTSSETKNYITKQCLTIESLDRTLIFATGVYHFVANVVELLISQKYTPVAIFC